MPDLTVYTTQATQTIQAKIITDTERMVAVTAWGAVDALDADTKERFYGLLEQA